MINTNSFKLGCGLIVSLTMGLSGCYMDSERYNQVDNSTQTVVNTAPATEHKPVQKTYATKDPAQQTTPGPKRSAAPQIPVIQ